MLEAKIGPRIAESAILNQHLLIPEEVWKIESYYTTTTSSEGRSTLTFGVSLDASYILDKEYDLFAGVAIGSDIYKGCEEFFCGWNHTPAETASGLGRNDEYEGEYLCSTQYFPELVLTNIHSNAVMNRPQE